MTHDEIVAVLVKYLMETNPLVTKGGQLPLDRSLYELGVLDSSGVVELVVFIEKRWSIIILDTELTHEMFGGLDKMASLIGKKLALVLARAEVPSGNAARGILLGESRRAVDASRPRALRAGHASGPVPGSG